MKFKLLFFISLPLLFLSPSKGIAQLEVGVSAGLSHNVLTHMSGYQYDRVYSPQNGVAVAIPVRYQVREWFAVQAEVAYTQKNYKWSRSPIIFPAGYDQAYLNSFLQLPVMANFSFGEGRLRGFLNLGGYVGAWIDSHTKGVFPMDVLKNSYYFDESVPFNSQRDNRFDAGLLLGIGLEYRINSSFRVFAEGRYQYGLTDLQKEYMIDLVPRYNNTLTFQAGVAFRIGK